jgi:signal transduction histidine kinase
LRHRFFSIIFLVLFIVGVSSAFLYNYFLHQERLTLIDAQIKETAAVLVSSELAKLKLVEIDRAEEILSNELGEDQIGKFFILRDEKGTIIYESTSSKVLPIAEVPMSPKWVTIKEKGQHIRVLNLALPRIGNRTLQVGAVIGQEILTPSYFSRNTFIYIISNLIIGLFVSFLLTSILLKPLTKLSYFLMQVTSKKESHGILPNLPKMFFNTSGISKRDEYGLLLNNLDTLIDRINRGHKISRFWSYQMAHELKTPLTILETDIEIASREKKISPELASEIRSGISTISNTVSTFLSWAEIENLQAPNESSNVNVKNMVCDIAKRLSKKYPERIKEVFNATLSVKCISQHLELLIQNLLINSLKYSPESSPVTIVVDVDKIKIVDVGNGISEKVKEHLGEPFNFDNINTNSKHGSGLGLAFVYSICNLYGWDIILNTSTTGTTFEILFSDFSKFESRLGDKEIL